MSRSLGFIVLHMLLNAHALPACLLLTDHLLAGASLDHKHIFTARIIDRVILQTVRKGGLHFLFVFLCQFAADCKPARPTKMLRKLGQSLYQMMRCLIDNDRARLLLQFCKYRLMLFLILWQKSLERKTSRRHSGHGQRCHTCSGSRKGSHRNSFLVTDPHDILSRI